MRTITISLNAICLVWLAIGNYSHAVTASVATDALNSALDEYRSRMEASRYQDALPFAEQIAVLVAEEDPLDPHAYALVLRHWANLQQKANLDRAAEKNYLKSIDIVEKQSGGYAPILVPTLSHLGGLYYKTGQYDKSLEVLRRAQHITHRQSGVYSLDQLDIVDWITQINLRKNQFQEADAQQRFYYTINKNNFGEDDPRIIPALTKLGYWYRQSGQYPSALAAFRRTLDLMEELQPTAEMELIKLLNAIASTLYLKGSCCADEPLARVLDLVVNSPSADKSDELEALIHLADMNLIQKRHEKAKKLYRQAWNMVASDTTISQKGKDLFSMPTRLGVNKTGDVVTAYRLAKNGYALPESVGTDIVHISNPGKKSRKSASVNERYPGSRQLVGEPLALCYPQVLDLARLKNADNLDTFYMHLDFTVSQKGKVIKVVVIDSNTPYKLGRFIKNMLSNTRFRPRFAAGEPVLTEHVELHQTFESATNRSHLRDTPLPSSTSAIFEGCQLLAAMNF